MILVIRTDRSEAQVGLFDGQKEIDVEKWEAGRQLADTLLDRIKDLLKKHNLEWKDLSGIVAFKGPGSFTGLRIGVTVANTIAYAQKIPIVDANGENWVSDGQKRLQKDENDTQIIPEYGAKPNITRPK
ncbi:MAG TPA: tRNA (adenosine(37)-N6)-threonylcarbamoyltransferase complex dimerization subunit type 1 TsaB [Candidatus Dormibacteraeota bacterium]|nr:tRNA (adenosine(37)-N6)-threonylcarbamoyltransferase complex dimerization subunit type 1 TsaB [Candidatus Dormibacteraeota bacterium]